ncbi:hypothetical protein F3A09_00420 [Salmonella enterica subsp. enterica serovar Typhi]|nr:hypothetical protein [Salmonella enterica subsp. enterica serovar Typhi]
MTNITLSTQHYRIHRSDVEPVKEKQRRRTFLQKVLLPLEIALSACRRVCQIVLACINKQTYRLPIFIVGAPLRVGQY